MDNSCKPPFVKNLHNDNSEIVFFDNTEIIKWSNFHHRAIVLQVIDKTHKQYKFKELSPDYYHINLFAKVTDYIQFKLNILSNYMLNTEEPIVNASIVGSDQYMGPNETKKQNKWTIISY